MIVFKGLDMTYVNNSKLKAKLACALEYSDLSRRQMAVFDNACRLSGVGRGLSRSRIFRLLQTLDTLTYDSLERRLNVSLKALSRESYSKRTIALYLSVCRKVASQLAQMYGIPRHETTIPESEFQYRPSVSDKRVFTVAERMLPKGAKYLIVSMSTLEEALRLKPRTIRESLKRLDHHGYIVCLGGDEGANYSITFKRSIHATSALSLQAA
ncbi:conserved hypothetical protein [Vibrio parahaemolyticus Peru-466]|uniref:Uncharacterized protein n=10 Tax=Vibrio harveyi group TaxID=717610 RepID=Q87J16_VIBPA|nr:hypothetical protein Vp2S01_A0417 [Vibrio parahaemolyticus]EFO36762.1 conserved hypothetical protein [Vibrio parahaemolyticus Peru-466]EFO41266.1 conserved hypothetical protein [Vibrio parahaemolyticus AN-5034]EFO51239.1 conserved hypothetical protein [Vibrio parahaemolyticus K5030]EQL90294.1 hypothetical protein D035_4060 [Vibrio parahaemolyticus VP250]EQL99678.1 hypothetical protein D040_0097 [Vibrio parahaemolyticus NIHCB0603]EQM03491.1 hypothetical protein D036_1198 [Vibrio parahaemoly